MAWLISRLSEKTTWAGIAVIAGTVVQIADGIASNTTAAGAVAAIAGGLVAVLAKEKTL